MPRGRKLYWTILGVVVAAVALVIVLIQVLPGPPRSSASSPPPHISASASPKASTPIPVVIPRTSSTSSFSYISALTPSSKLGELVYPGPVTIHGAIYPESVSFYCDDGDLPSFPAVYRLTHNARQFDATVGVEAKWPASYQVGVSLVGDGRTLRSFTVSVLKPATVAVNVTGIHVLTLECFAPGIVSAASAANVEVAWGNARVTDGR